MRNAAIATDRGERNATVVAVDRNDSRDALIADVRKGLAVQGHRSIPPTYFYDSHGAELYERITGLPEYYQTRTEAALLEQIASELCRITGRGPLIELGSGSATKTRLLLDAWDAAHAPTTYVPIDVNQEVLEEIAGTLTASYPALDVLALAGRYREALDAVPPMPGALFLFLGGTLGNLSPAEESAFFDHLARRIMLPGSHLLLGFDLPAGPRKPASLIEAAYNDAEGVTARFNLNLLTRLNRELGADFDLDRWAHEALYVAEAERIEMRLVSRIEQQVTIAALGERYDFAAGERLLTELSRRFDPERLASGLARHGLRRTAAWTDPAERYALLLLARH